MTDWERTWKREKILLAVPVYNEERALAEVLSALCHMVPRQNILLVNDGSTDQSQNIINAHQLQYIKNDVNCGKGSALLQAVRFARANRFRWLITMDGDGQHDPGHLKDFVKAIQRNSADLIIGVRQQKKRSMPRLRQMSNGISSVLISLLIGRNRIHDTQCGYRAVRLARINIPDYRETGFQFESELLLRLGRSITIIQVPIATHYGSERSKIRNWADSFKFIRLLLRYIWLYS
ncbi:glycosyltransferase family 2 protein [candidate division KSB1 bacterium]|nr:glycosyltransferase family 2 protein [candidate division KSB1 bacterium]